MIELTVYGDPVPMGSKKAFIHKGRAIVTDQQGQKLKTWQSNIRSEMLAVAPKQLMTGPLKVCISFYMARPKSHYGTGKNSNAVRDSAPFYHTQTPDVDKLVRAVLDCGTGILWRDDSQVCVIEVDKVWHESARTCIAVEEF